MKILVIRVSAIGDVIHTFPSIFLLKRLFPGCKISWVVQEKAVEILQGQTFLEEVFVLKNKFLRPKNWIHTLRVIKQLRSQKWDLILDFQGILKTSILLSFLKGAKFGFSKEHARDKFSTFFTKYHVEPVYKNIIQKNLALVSDINLRCLFEQNINKEFLRKTPLFEDLKKDFNLTFFDREKEIVDGWIAKNNLNKFMIVAPNTTWPSKHLPLQTWQDLLRRLAEKDLKVVLFGTFFGQPGIDLAKFCAKEKLKIFIPSKLNLNQTAYLISKSDLLIGPDTGLVHLADFLQIKTISIFGPTMASVHGPFVRVENIENAIQIPCFHYRQKVHGKNNSENCMAKLSVDEILQRIDLVK